MDMGFPAARLFTDKVVGFPHCHVPGHPPGPPIPTPILGVLMYPDPLSLVFGRPSVFINKLPAAVLGDPGFHVFCCGPNKFEISTGSSTVNIEGERAARAIDFTKHCDMGMPAIPPVVGNRGMIVSGSPNVLIGGFPLPDFFSIGLGITFKGLAKIRNLAKAGKLGKKAQTILENTSQKLHQAANKVMDRLGINKFRDMVHSSICSFTGHPVDIATGKVMTFALDFSLSGLIELNFKRTYKSTNKFYNTLGYGWTHNYEMSIQILNNQFETFIVYRDDEGREIDFDYIQPGEKAYNRFDKLLLFRTNKSFILTKQNIKFVFINLFEDDVFQLVEILDSNGNKILIKYNNLKRIDTIIDSTGRELIFNYDDLFIKEILLNLNDKKHNLKLVSFYYVNNNLVAVEDQLNNKMQYKYDNNLLVTETNKNGYTYHFLFDEKEYCIKTWGEDDQFSRELIYDTKNRETLEIRKNGLKKKYRYNIFGVVETETDEFNDYKGIKKTEWDDRLNRISYTDQNGNTTRWKYDNENFLIESRDPNNNVELYYYDQKKNIIQIIDPCKNVWKYEYDVHNNLNLIIDPLNRKVKIDYNNQGKITSIINTYGAKTNYKYDKFGNIIQIKNEIGLSRYKYDFLGRVTEKIDIRGRKYYYEYNLRNNIIKVNSNGLYFINEYDSEDNLIIHQKLNAKIIQNVYDRSNRLIKYSNESENGLRYEYDYEGNIIKIFNEKDDLSELYYDPINRIIKHNYIDERIEEYYYDLVGKTIKIKNLETEINYNYDKNGNLISKISVTGEKVFYKYDSLNRIVYVKNDNVILTYSYDKIGRLVKETQNDLVLIYHYDDVNNQIELLLSNNRRIVYKYDKSDQLVSIDDSLCGYHKFEYNYGLLVKHTYPNNLVTLYSYDDRDRLIKQDLIHHTGKIIGSRRYEYDLDSNLLTFYDNEIFEYKYNSQNFLISVKTSNFIHTYVYDKSGNILKNKNYDYLDYTKIRLNSSNESNYKYDGNGNIVEITDNQQRIKFTYNSDNMITKIKSNDNKKIEFKYDPYGRRVLKNVNGIKTQYFWNNDILLGENNESVIHYLFIPGTFIPIACNHNGKLFFYHTDIIGRPREISDSSGDIIESIFIDEMGYSPETKVICPFRLAGQYYDKESGLHYNRFRYYDPKIGRYISPDPIGLAGGLNTYRYGTNIFRSLDPLGLADIYAGNRRAAHAAAKRRAGVPDSMQPIQQGTFRPGSRGATAGTMVHTMDPTSQGRWYKYEIPKEGGGTKHVYVIEHDNIPTDTGFIPDHHFHAAENKIGHPPIEKGGEYQEIGEGHIFSRK